MKPSGNDVLSGRGAGFNQHPGNEHFRRIIEQQKSEYSKGTKKQKMNMSNSIVEAIYSMEPPGRFLKQCPDTGRWKELSKREAADRVAQAMAYAVRGKAKSKQRREERRRSRSSSSRQKSKDDAAANNSSQSADRPAQLRAHATNNNHQSEDSGSSSAARHDNVARGGGAVGTNSNAQSASEMLLPDISNLQQQLLIQRLLQSSRTTLPTTSSMVDQNGGLARLLLIQTLQQQQQQLPLLQTLALGQNSLGLQAQLSPLQPALLEALTQLLNQTQQQQQQQQRNEQQQEQLLLQRLLNQQTALPSATLPPTLPLSAPFLTGPRSDPADSNLLPNQVHLQSNPSNALLLSLLTISLHQPNSNDVGISDAPRPHGGRQMDQLQRSLILQQQQLLASPLGAVSNDHPLYQQQQSRPLDPILEQAALQLRQILQDPPLPLINSSAELLHPPSSRGEEIGKRRR